MCGFLLTDGPPNADVLTNGDFCLPVPTFPGNVDPGGHNADRDTSIQGDTPGTSHRPLTATPSTREGTPAAHCKCTHRLLLSFGGRNPASCNALSSGERRELLFFFFFYTRIQIFISLFISAFYKVYIHTIWPDKIHFVSGTERPGRDGVGIRLAWPTPPASPPHHGRRMRVFRPWGFWGGRGCYFCLSEQSLNTSCRSRHAASAQPQRWPGRKSNWLLINQAREGGGKATGFRNIKINARQCQIYTPRN